MKETPAAASKGKSVSPKKKEGKVIADLTVVGVAVNPSKVAEKMKSAEQPSIRKRDAKAEIKSKMVIEKAKQSAAKPAEIKPAVEAVT